MRLCYLTICLALLSSCSNVQPQEETLPQPASQLVTGTSLVILGTIQDAGSPQIGCTKACCAALFTHPDHSRQVISLGLVDVPSNKTYLFEATPDIGSQIHSLVQHEKNRTDEMVDGIFLSHAHIGHYTGLMYLGKEAMNAQRTPVYVMPRMKAFLTTNGPWSQLVSQDNIQLMEMENEAMIPLSDELHVTPFLVPHRDEYSETVGYTITGPSKSALFIPDIDKWGKWEKDINEEIKKVDYAFLDATFYSGKELNNRDITQIPHPFISESFQQFESLSEADKSKVIFIHFNHTNPVIDPSTEEAKEVVRRGFRIGKINEIFPL